MYLEIEYFIERVGLFLYLIKSIGGKKVTLLVSASARAIGDCLAICKAMDKLGTKIQGTA